CQHFVEAGKHCQYGDLRSMRCHDRFQAYSRAAVELLHARKQSVSQIRVETRFVVPMRDTEALQIEDAKILRGLWSGNSGETTSSDCTGTCRSPQQGQQDSTGDHRQSPLSKRSTLKWIRKRPRKLYHRTTGCQI